MIFLNFSQLLESVFRPNFQETLSWKPSQIFLWLESVFRWQAFLMANKHRKVWKLVSRKVNSGKQTNFSNGKQTQEKFGKWFPKKWIQGNKHSLSNLLLITNCNWSQIAITFSINCVNLTSLLSDFSDKLNLTSLLCDSHFIKILKK
jgi:hypothetical protein